MLDHPRVIQVRSFSKVHAMAGFRVGYAIVPDGGPDLAPVLGVGAPALAGALWAVENGADAARRRRAQADAQRARLAAEFPVADGRRSLRVAGAAGGGGAGGAADLRRARTAWGDERHVRVTLYDDAATDRLLAALREL